MRLLRLFKNVIRNFLVSRHMTINKYICNIGFETEGMYLISTKRGLYQLRNNKLFLVLLGDFYGVTRKKNKIYVFQRIKPQGRILELRVDKNFWVESSKIFMNNLSPGCHQLDLYQNSLYVCDTYNNRIMQIDLEDKGNIKYYYPLGKLKKGRESKNYGHINSIYIRENDVIIVCHNESQKTNRHSQIIILDKNFSIREVTDTRAGSAHNVAPFGKSFLYCDSMNGNLNLDHKIVFKASCFTRGLSLTKGYILLGGGEYAVRERRDYGKGYLFILDQKNFRLLHRYVLSSMVQEIRRLDKADFGFSENIVD